jgi:GT2 family glycosyltransferase/septal ring factor EnvC (AmiA/AmiB activator)
VKMMGSEQKSSRDRLAGDSGKSGAVLRVGSDMLPARRPVAETTRPIVVVLGMHRSGTSLLSNMLHVLGVDMADTTDHVSPKNPGGFWERPDLVAIHDEILDAIGRPIALPSHVLPFPPAWWRSKQVQALKPKLIDYVGGQLSNSSNPWGFKDPRTCRLLPLWWEVFRELNLEPLYVNGLRAPAEASVSMSQKSSVRKLSVANSELMWLSYNYDIARFVTLKSPSFVVDYAEWFSDPVAVAQRLCEQLGIGHDLSPDDIAECVASIVRPDYRHQFDQSAPTGSLAGMLYKSLAASNPLGEGDLRALRGHVRVVEMFFKSVASVVHDLDEAASTRAKLESERSELFERNAAAKQELTDKERTAGQLLAEKVAVEQQLSEKEKAAEQLLAERIAVEQRLSEKEKAVEQLLADKTAAEQQLGEKDKAVEQLLAEKIAVEHRLAENERTAQKLIAEKTSAAESLQRAIAELEREVAKAHANGDAVQREIEHLRGTLAGTRQALDGSKARAAALERRFNRERRRSRTLLRSAREWRDTYVAEHGETDVRIELTARAAELQHSLAAAERQLASAEEERARFIAELELRDKALAALRREQTAPRQVSGSEPRIFTWPSDGEPIAVSGEIDRADEEGIAGQIRIRDRADIVPVVEVRIDGSLAAAQTCLAIESSSRTGSEGRWRFFFSWERFGPEHAGKQAVVMVAGIDQELGQAAVPAALRAYHLSPAARVASELGGTVAEAAEYHRWIRECEGPEDAELARAYRGEEQTLWPMVRIIVYGEDGRSMQLTLQSLQKQVHADWQALCVDAPAEVADIDPRIRVIASTALDDAIAEYGEDALFSFVQAGDLLSDTALLHLVEAARDNPGFSLIYSDEDLVDAASGLRGVPFMKGAWSPDLALSRDYICRLALVRGENLIRRRSRIDSAAIYEMVLRAALSGNGPVVHLPFVVYHRAAANASQSPSMAGVIQSVIDSTPALSGATAITGDQGRTKIRWPMPRPEPRVSLIVPTRDRADLLRVCVGGFLHETRYENLEVLIADNDSQEEEAKVYLAKVSTHPRVRVIPCPGPFNFSKINNLAAEHATGEIIGLMNNDLKIFEPDWLREMVSHAVRKDVGIVGAKLLYEDDTIQHAGVTLGISLASHLYKFSPGGAEGRQGRLNTTQDVSAVTAACLVMRREVWDEVGGLDEDFPVAYNDVDLCLRVRAAGYRILWTPKAVLYHLESRTRGKDAAPEKRERLNQDKSRLVQRWGDALLADPFHSPNFSGSHTDSRLSFPPRAAAPWQPAIAAQ